jgi:hypothetical protein
MRKLISCGIAVVVLAGFVVAATAADSPAAKNPDLGHIRHVVIFKFKSTATPEQIRAIEEEFRALPSKIPGIIGFEWGTNVSPETHSAGFTHLFFLTFADAKARDAYLPHPAHKAFGKVLGPYMEKVLVIDYVAKD